MLFSKVIFPWPKPPCFYIFQKNCLSSIFFKQNASIPAFCSLFAPCALQGVLLNASQLSLHILEVTGWQSVLQRKAPDSCGGCCACTDLCTGGGFATALKSHKHDNVAPPLGRLPCFHTWVDQLLGKQDQWREVCWLARYVTSSISQRQQKTRQANIQFT